MSSIVIAGDTSGSVTLQAPAIAGTTTLTLPATSGTLGDVVGPASSTDDAIARFDLATGKLIQNSTGILTDAGAISGLTDITATGLVRTSGTGFQNGNTTDSYGKFFYSTSTAVLTITNEYNSGGAGSTYGEIVFKNYNANQGTLTERMRISGSGNLLIGTTSSPATSGGGSGFINDGENRWQLIQNQNTTDPRALQSFRNPNGAIGSIQTSGSATSFNTSSDYRLKNTIAPMTGALAKVALLKPCTYKWNCDGSDSQGFIAHELAEVVPQCVTGEKDGTRIEKYEISPAIPATFDEQGNELTPAILAVMGEREVPDYQGIDTSFLVATLTAAIQEQQALITTLTERITALEGA